MLSFALPSAFQRLVSTLGLMGVKVEPAPTVKVPVLVKVAPDNGEKLRPLRMVKEPEARLAASEPSASVLPASPAKNEPPPSRVTLAALVVMWVKLLSL